MLPRMRNQTPVIIACNGAVFPAVSCATLGWWTKPTVCKTCSGDIGEDVSELVAPGCRESRRHVNLGEEYSSRSFGSDTLYWFDNPMKIVLLVSVALFSPRRACLLPCAPIFATDELAYSLQGSH